MVTTPSSSGGTPIVEASGLVKTFRDFWMRDKARAVDGIDFEIRPNELFGLLGPNGSGKSTTIKMILGLLRRTRGKLLVLGRDPGDVKVKAQIGYLPEESYLYRFLTARETLDYYGKLFGLDKRTRVRRTDELLSMVGLDNLGHRQVGEFSKGMARRLGIAQALINDPAFLILDEPTSGLDPIGTRQVKDLLVDLRNRGKTILLSSHLLADVEDVCDRMVILYGGKIHAQGTADELLADTRHTVIQSTRLDDATIQQIDEVIRVSTGEGIERVSAPRQRLESYFLDLVERAVSAQSSTSGAKSGGATAAFLKGSAMGEATGEDLVEALAAGTSEAPALRATSRAEAKPGATEPAADLSGVETVTSQKAGAGPATLSTPPSGTPSGTTRPSSRGSSAASGGPDLGVIEGLLGDGPDRSGQSRTDGGGRGT